MKPTQSFRTNMEKVRTVYAKAPGAKGTAELVIQDFLEVMKTSKPGKRYVSDTFMVGATPMAIKVYPNGDEDESSGNVSVFLENHSDAALRVKYQFVTEAKTWGFDTKFEAKASLGRHKFLSHAQCEDAFKEKDFLVTVNVEILGEKLKIMGNDNAVAPKKICVCRKVYEEMMDPNFTLVFNGSEVACHKHILAATSPVFKAMVVNQHLEAIESKANIELSEEVGRSFVKYLYTGELEEDILKEHALAFLELGNKYLVQELKDLAEGEMLKQLKKKNMVRFLSIGDIFNANKIFEAALKMTKANINWLCSQVYDE